MQHAVLAHLRSTQLVAYLTAGVLAIAGVACSDVGDSSAGPQNSTGEMDAASPQGGGGADAQPTADGTMAAGDVGADAVDSSSAQDTGAPSTDSSLAHDANVNAYPDVTVTGLPEAGPTDTMDAAEAADVGPDTRVPEADSGGSPDATAVDASPIDATVVDVAEPKESGVDVAAGDATAQDATLADASLDTSSEAAADVAADVAAEASSSGGCPVAGDVKNSAGQCVSTVCQTLNGGANCDLTATAFAHKSADCYSCLVNGDCLDNAMFMDVGKDCDDLTGNATGGARAGTSNEQLCLDKLSCIVSTSCASVDINLCYCGSLGAGNTCATATTPGDGKCAQQEVDGSNHLITDPGSMVLPDLANQLLPAGLVDQIFVCAHSNQCDSLCSMP
jgi:hypothetical protein